MTPQTPEQPFALQQMAPRQRRWMPYAIAGLVALALVGVSVGAYAMTRPERVAEDKTATLIEQCRAEAKKSLKAPATAQFSEERPVELGDRFYYIDGSVDAQNGFGALVRSKYRCKAESTASGWSVVRVEFSD